VSRITRIGCAPLRLHGVGLGLLATDAAERGDGVCTHAHRRRAEALYRGRIHDERRTVRGHRHARHGFDATGHHQDLASRDAGRRLVEGPQARGAVVVHRRDRHGIAPAGFQRGDLADVAALFATLRDAADDHLADARGLESRATHQLGQHSAEQ
jgi:hypothetical protein